MKHLYSLLKTLLLKSPSYGYVFLTNHKYIVTLLFLIVAFAQMFFYKFSIGSIIFFMFFIGAAVYFHLYKVLNIDYSTPSFFAFILNYIIFVCYMRGCYMVFIGIETPIYIENLSSFSNMRYVLFSILGLIGVVIYVLTYLYILPDYLSSFKYPYLKEEVRKVLYTWQDSWLGDLWIYFIDNFNKGYLVFISVFLLLYRCLLTLFFINFCFFKGDLRYILYMIPISFIIWVFSFFHYYFIWFVEQNVTYIRDLLLVTFKNNSQFTESTLFVTTSKDNLNFQLTEYGQKEGFTNERITSLSDTWLKLSNVHVFLKKQQRLTLIFSYVTFMLNFFCWLYLSYMFLASSENVALLTPSFFYSVWRHGLFSKAFIYRSPRDARYVHERYMNDLREASKGKYSPGHPVYGEETPQGKFRVDGSLTHGTGTAEHQAQPLLDTSIDPNAKKQVHKAILHWMLLLKLTALG